MTDNTTASPLALVRVGRLFPTVNRAQRPPAPGPALRLGWVLTLLALHVLLGVLCKTSRWAAAAHALGTLAFGLYLALTSREPLRVAYWAAYAVGAEVLWRLAQAPLPWEYAKYAISLVLLIRFLRTGLRRAPWTPVAYFLPLLPAVILTLLQLPLPEARSQLSFNLSGPLTLTVCALFCSQVRLDDERVRRLLAWLALPVSAIATVILFGLTVAENVEFRSGSNFLASGGFGPNQVSSILGLGALFLVLVAFQPRVSLTLRCALLAMALWFLAHAALSFSRTGVYLFGVGLLAAAPFLPRQRLMRPGTIILLCLALLTGLATWTYLVRFTGGKIRERFADTGATGRDRIAVEDFQIWKRNVVLGVGVGLSSFERTEALGQRVAAHTEYTRLIAEHGLLGLAAGLMLFLMASRPIFRWPAGFTKAAIIAGVTVALASLAASGMRTAAPGLLIGLACARPLLQPRRVLLRQRPRAVVPHAEHPETRGEPVIAP